MTAPETSSAKNKRKKIVDDDINAHLDVKIQLANKLNKKTRREKSQKTTQGSPRSSAGSDHAGVDVTSCCSFNNSRALAQHEERNNNGNDNNTNVDLNEESDDEDSDQAESRSTYNPLRESRRGMAPNSSDNLRRQKIPEEGGRGSTTVKNPKMPTESELEEFFTAEEKDIQSKFSIKYNYDVTNDEPLEGPYEWSRLKP